MADPRPDSHQPTEENEAGNQDQLNTSAEHDGPSSEEARNAVRNLGDRIDPAPQNNDEEEEESKDQIIPNNICSNELLWCPKRPVTNAPYLKNSVFYNFVRVGLSV